ncbi:MAG: hypothetical protein IKF99_02145 [Oscillospiraceae bacterium]|nr:hypothetical protein [Oscillospiraceae bacterium]
MTIFELVRQEVTAENVARLYGLRFGRNGRAVCPWHDDHNPDLRFYGNGTCFCFACHAGGDAVALAAQILSLSPKEAAERLRADFHLDQPISNRPDPATTAEAKQRRDAHDRFNKQWGFLCDVLHEADAELPRYDKETAWDTPRFVAVLKARTLADERLNVMETIWH